MGTLWQILATIQENTRDLTKTQGQTDCQKQGIRIYRGITAHLRLKRGITVLSI